MRSNEKIIEDLRKELIDYIKVKNINKQLLENKALYDQYKDLEILLQTRENELEDIKTENNECERLVEQFKSELDKKNASICQHKLIESELLYDVSTLREELKVILSERDSLKKELIAAKIQNDKIGIEKLNLENELIFFKNELSTLEKNLQDQYFPDYSQKDHKHLMHLKHLPQSSNLSGITLHQINELYDDGNPSFRFNTNIWKNLHVQAVENLSVLGTEMRVQRTASIEVRKQSILDLFNNKEIVLKHNSEGKKESKNDLVAESNDVWSIISLNNTPANTIKRINCGVSQSQNSSDRNNNHFNCIYRQGSIKSNGRKATLPTRESQEHSRTSTTKSSNNKASLFDYFVYMAGKVIGKES